ncbi:MULTISPECIES: hypothetical protein [unclassified Leptolyngbya]|uniref:hypothetical protein n=1 Tax=unclassified Leptolyngbya TaxID=2650499 RepID=UPI0016839D0F|nr:MULTISPECIES: hypothetical protein [unclassified Leptolyngbya]MBD1910853.1 hypothetical protein [Leptolyngbya sp. FACHB-8]MBD2153752.1 hypothetical protein [Leptolyngbya sp. FACHB-16]
MTAVPKPLVPYPRSPRSRQDGSLQAINSSRPMPLAPRSTQPSSLAVRPSAADLRLAPPGRRQNSAPTVQSLPVSRSMPAGLRTLMLAQQVATPLTFLVIAVTAVFYGWTVYTQQLWSQQYHRLEALQRQERQLMAADEVLKNDLAQQALNPNSGLITSDLNTTVFLDAPPPVSSEAIAPTAASAPAPEVEPARPFAY